MRNACFKQLLLETYSLNRFLHRFLMDMQKAEEPEALIQLVDKYEPCLLKSKKFPDFYSSIKHCFGDLRKSQTEPNPTNVYKKLLSLWSQLNNIENLFPWEEVDVIIDSGIAIPP